MVITPETSVREIVTAFPATIPLLERFGIDYCCGGARTLTEACGRRNIDVNEVVTAIERQEEASETPVWTSLGELCGYITNHHHAYTRRQLNLIAGLLAKVQQVHGAAHPELIPIGQAFAAIQAELTHHFHCEEDVLFPYITKLEQSPASAHLPMFQSLHQPVQRMLAEHDQAGEKLGQLRDNTNNYRPPSDACTTFRALWRAFEALERDLHLHIHLENNILFPRALALTEEVLR
ncbi:MAG TPA: iron-sulfur cluster repair di-iron protein [Bryobacteraceae bacterium]